MTFTHWMIALGALFTALGAVTGMVRQLQMLQLNSYYNTRYLKWLSGAFGWRGIAGLFVAAWLACYLFLTRGWLCIPLPCLAFAALAVRLWWQIREQKRAKKPLKVTARVKRLCVTAFVIMGALVILCALLPDLDWLFAAIVILLWALTPLLALAANLINTPVERAVAGRYIRDAKQRLAGIPGLRVIGITGSYGKTSTKYILGRLLSEKYQVTMTPESFNTPMGVVRTVREHWKPGTEIFLAEMGAKRVGDIEEVCRICHPTMGVITSVGPQHLDTFRTIENVAKTKFELYDAVSTAGGQMFLNAQSEWVKRQAGERDAVWYGEEGSYCWAQDITYSRHGAAFTLCGADGRRLAVKTQLLGKHNVLNIVAAVSVAWALGVSDEQIRFAVSSLTPIEHRLQLRPFLGGSVLIDDAFNSNPQGCLAAVEVLGSFEGCKKIIVTPGLVELGEKEYDCNYALGGAAAKVCDEIYLVGEQRAEPMARAARDAGCPEERLHIVKTFQDAMEHLAQTVTKDCAVLFENDLPDNYAK